MTMQMVGGQHRQVAVDMVGPIVKTSANAYAVVVGSEIDARPWGSVAYTLAAITNAVTWVIFGANTADYSDEVQDGSETSVAAAAAGSYASAPAPYAYYRVKIKSTAEGAHGVATVSGIAKG